MVPLTVIVTTRNEERNIGTCLESLKGFVNEIFVIDSDSTDRTVEIARRYTERVINLPYEHGRIIPWIYQWGLDNLPISNEWIMILEADQRPSEALKQELAGLVTGKAVKENGFYIKRRQVFRGKLLRFGGYGSKYMLKVFRKGAGQLDPVEQDTRVYITGKAGKLSGVLLEENLKESDILFYLEKHLRYAEAFSQEEIKRRTKQLQWKGVPRLFGSPDERVLWLKTCYYRMPLYIRPFCYFIYRYIFLLGFLDGKNGFIFHFLQAFWFRLIIDIRLEELLNDRRGPEEM